MSSNPSKSNLLDEVLRTNRLWEEQYHRLARDTEKVILELKRQLRDSKLENDRSWQSRQVELEEASGNPQDEIQTLRCQVAASESAKRKAEEQMETLTSKMEFLERHCEEETANRERACGNVEKLEKEVKRLTLQVRNLSDERDELLAVREQADLFRQDFLSEREEKQRVADENKRLRRKLEDHAAPFAEQGGHLSLSRELGFAVTDELVKLQADRWSEYNAAESDTRMLVPRGANNSTVIECQGQ